MFLSIHFISHYITKFITFPSLHRVETCDVATSLLAGSPSVHHRLCFQLFLCHYSYAFVMLYLLSAIVAKPTITYSTTFCPKKYYLTYASFYYMHKTK